MAATPPSPPNRRRRRGSAVGVAPTTAARSAIPGVATPSTRARPSSAAPDRSAAVSPVVPDIVELQELLEPQSSWQPLPRRRFGNTDLDPASRPGVHHFDY